MRIAILGKKGVPGHHGVEVVVDSLLPHLTSLGHEITVYGYGSYTEPIDDYHGARVKTVAGSSRKNLERPAAAGTTSSTYTAPIRAFSPGCPGRNTVSWPLPTGRRT
jgi:hypothetical protein